ncbi:MAG: hypothetical protein KAS38_17730 [Anaerolineales bacterium]|nr:hypothetical protein [Anaerolineales bacterium]
MRDRNLYGTNDPRDAYIRQSLKNWAVQEHPPASVRTRILLVAASPLSQQVQSSSHEDMYGSIKPLTPKLSFSNPAVDLFKQPWLLVLHPSLGPLRYIP